MQEITKGFNALLTKGGKLLHKFEIRVEIYSFGFYLYEYKDKKQTHQTPRSSVERARIHLIGLRAKYRAMGCTIIDLDGVTKYRYNLKTLLYEPKE